MWVHANSPELLRSRELIEPGHATKQTLWKPLCYDDLSNTIQEITQLFLESRWQHLVEWWHHQPRRHYALKLFPWESRAGAISMYRVNDNRFIYRISQRLFYWCYIGFQYYCWQTFKGTNDPSSIKATNRSGLAGIPVDLKWKICTM